MRITSIELQKNNKDRVNIFCDDEYTFSLSKNGVVDFNLYNGKELKQEDINYIKEKDSFNVGMSISLNYLGYGMKTKKEIVDKLKKKEIPEEYIEKIIDKLMSYGYINDEIYIKTYISSKAIPSKWGKAKTQINLQKKGIDRNILKPIMDELYDCDEIDENIKILIDKKIEILKKRQPEKNTKDKLYRFLLSKGYSFDDINEVATYIQDKLKE